MNSSELLLEFRRQVDDLAEPYLWSDEEVFGYLDDAQKMFCRRTEGIEDSRTEEVCTINIVPGTEWYPRSPLILKVRSAAHRGSGRPADILTPENAARQGLRFGPAHTGPVRALVDGQTKGFWRAWPAPNDAAVIDLAVFRLPLDRITDAGDQPLEIDEQHHRHLLLWMKYLAYSKQDADTYDPRQADKHQLAFLNYCASARVEQERARRQTGVVAYGGL